MKYFLLLSLLLGLSACQNLPTPAQADNADYGAFPDTYKSIVRSYLMDELRDPASIEIRGMTEPKKRWIGDKVTGLKYGYLVCTEVNSKNIFNKLTGFRTDALLIRDNSVIDYIKDGKLISGMQLCN